MGVALDEYWAWAMVVADDGWADPGKRRALVSFGGTRIWRAWRVVAESRDQRPGTEGMPLGRLVGHRGTWAPGHLDLGNARPPPRSRSQL